MGEKKVLSNIQEGYQAFVLKKCLRQNPFHCHVVASDTALDFLKEVLALVAKDVRVITFPEFDTVPYDRVSPRSDIVGERIDTLTFLANKEYEKEGKCLILTTIGALVQKVPEVCFFKDRVLALKEGDSYDFEALNDFLLNNSYKKVNTVINTGEYAIRGGLVDIFPAGSLYPVRVDFFGNEIDEMKFFDPTTQRTLKKAECITLKPMAELALNKQSIALFRTRYREVADNAGADYLYEAVSNGIFVNGLEHYLPFFHEKLGSLFDYLEGFCFSFDFQTSKALDNKLEQIADYYHARCDALTRDLPLQEERYIPVPKEEMFLTKAEVEERLNQVDFYQFSPFLVPDSQDEKTKQGFTFVEVRHKEPELLFERVASFILEQKKPVIITASSFGSAERLKGLLRDKKVALYEAEAFKDALKKAPAILVAPFENGFEAKDFILITETDILGERILRRPKKQKKVNFITDIASLNKGDLVVHQTHGVGRFEGLKALMINAVTHDCLELTYEGGDKLFIPVENLDVLSRYGSEGASLDHLGSKSFITRKERVKKDLLEMAGRLIEIASHRTISQQEKILPPHGAYQEFCARFPYVETEDQTRTIQEIEADLASGNPMDRLVCGDVGFGKTEVALRAAFLSAMAGKQVALIVPTTLLAMQHLATFQARFQGFPIRVGGLSRLVTGQKAKQVQKELETGILDIVIGTHALLSKSIRFKNLGLVIVDEEQHFGVTHKERLKELKNGVHVLTLTATPIPRTLQLALSGVRSLSVIATPPVDRLAVKTFVMPFDPVIIKEAILREYLRGGQVFYVCPRISDMPEIRQMLEKLIPEVKVLEAHGQMSAGNLEKIMSDFSAHKADVLLATSIVESGLDIKAVNTIIIHKADMFGLAGLYQMRGRVGRGKQRAYAYLTTKAFKRLSPMAEKRLTVMQNLDSLGAGFTLASHDLDIRGAGNLLGDEQSGHIKEVGIALYQKMLYEAIKNLKENKKEVIEDDFSPQISMGFPVIIPQSYVPELDLRMELYHRASELTDEKEVESFAVEMADRFGAIPKEVENLFSTLKLKVLAKKANIERLDVGPKGAVIKFYQDTFKNPAGLIAYVQSQMGTIQIKPDQKMVVMRPWGDIEARFQGVYKMIERLAEIANKA